jgi:flagellar hook-associated protein 2
MATTVQGVGSISSIGLGSGIDASAIINQLMAVESQPLNQLKTQASTLGTELSNFGKLQSYTSALQDRATALTSTTLWKQTTATSSNSAAVAATTSSGALAGNYQVQVQSLASVQSTVSGTYASADATFVEGELGIELGTWNGAVFTPKSGSSLATLQIAGGSTLSQVRDQINNAGAGVVATIVADASGARLSIRSLNTGADNAFRLTGSAGAAALSYSGGDGGGATMARTQTAANAQATLNGISISSASNTLENVVDGLTLKLQTTTASPVDVTVATDTEAIRSAITGFASAFNDLAAFIREQTKYDPGSKKAGALQGDRTAVGLQGQLRAVLNQESTASANWKTLSEIGLVLKTDGTFETKSTRLDNALANPAELRKLLASDGADNASSGFARRFKDLAAQLLGTDGAFEARTKSINARLSRNSKDQDRMEQRLAQTEARLRAQYNALDASMAQLNNLGNYMTQQLNAFNNQR